MPPIQLDCTAPAEGARIATDALDAVRAEIVSIEAELARAGRGADTRWRGTTGALALRQRLDALREVLAAAVPEPDPSVAAIGRRVTLEDESGHVASYAIVLPGDGDPSRGWVSIGSPLGRAVAGRRVGDRPVVHAPGGVWSARIVAVG